jgi:hypothetical protein
MGDGLVDLKSRRTPFSRGGADPSTCIARASTFWDLVRKLHPHDEARQKAWMKVHQKRLLDRGKAAACVPRGRRRAKSITSIPALTGSEPPEAHEKHHRRHTHRAGFQGVLDWSDECNISARKEGFEMAERIRIGADCFARNAERMCYPEFRRKHLDVGSGAIEAGCKNRNRFSSQQSAMFWTRDSISIAIAGCRLY